MDKVNKYKQIVRKIVEETGKLGDRPDKPIRNQFIIDEERGHYLLYFNGWKDEKRTYGCYLHIDVHADGKVYLEHDGTDLIIGQQLLDQGIAKSDLVLGFHSPVKRSYTDFAVA